MNRNKSIAIIGGGTAGLSLAYNLSKAGYSYKLFERTSGLSNNGLGFLIMANGLAFLKKMGLYDVVRKEGKIINEYISINTTGERKHNGEIGDCLAITREQCLLTIRDNLESHNLLFNKQLTGISVDPITNKKSLSFDDGYTEDFDLVIASDGIHSIVRNYLYPHHPKQEVRYKEIVGMSFDADIVNKLGHQFLKYIDTESGFNIGIIPGNHNTVIWFLQFNLNKIDTPENNQEAIQSFIEEIITNIPSDFKFILNHSLNTNLYLWTLYDVGLVESFYKDGIVLLGDAAHPLLSFTSQGVNSALEDAWLLSELIVSGTSFETFDKIRKPVIAEYLSEGKELLNQFLYPEKYDSFKVPFIQHK